MLGNLLRAFLILLIIFISSNKSFGGVKRCLFIGDSYFSHNDLSKEFLAVWNEEISDTLLITTHNRDGATIVSQWRYYSDELPRVIESQMWDYVIIELPKNGFPYSVLVDASTNKILSSDHRIEEHEMYLK